MCAPSTSRVTWSKLDMSSGSVVSVIKQPYNLSSSLLIFLRVKITWLPVCLPDTLPIYAAGVLTGSGLPLKKDTSNPGGVSKAKGVAANPHSTLVNDDEKAQVKFTEQPAVPLTTFPLYEDVKLWFTASKVKNYMSYWKNNCQCKTNL